MSNKSNKLNAEQLAAVKYIEGPLLVLAGAGSGKTRVITQKITSLIQNDIYKPQNICAVTFTNKAATEMQNRISKELPQDKRRGLKISTFHTLGLSIIKRNANYCNLKAGFSIFDSEDSMQIMRNFIPTAKAQDRDEMRKIVQVISKWKNDMLTPHDLTTKELFNEELIAIAELYTQYQSALISYNALDFDDLIRYPVLMLKNDNSIQHYWQNKIKYLLIDEYQDSNNCQYELVKLLIGKTNGLTAVGDDCQSIYAWRGAKPENF